MTNEAPVNFAERLPHPDTRKRLEKLLRQAPLNLSPSAKVGDRYAETHDSYLPHVHKAGNRAENEREDEVGRAMDALLADASARVTDKAGKRVDVATALDSLEHYEQERARHKQLAEAAKQASPKDHERSSEFHEAQEWRNAAKSLRSAIVGAVEAKRREVAGQATQRGR